jgi:hypothetical protein
MAAIGVTAAARMARDHRSHERRETSQCSRDRTRTYNLPVNRRCVIAGYLGLSTASARAACIKACRG